MITALNLLFHAFRFKVVSLLLVAVSLAVALLLAAFANILYMELHSMTCIFFIIIMKSSLWCHVEFRKKKAGTGKLYLGSTEGSGQLSLLVMHYITRCNTSRDTEQ